MYLCNDMSMIKQDESLEEYYNYRSSYFCLDFWVCEEGGHSLLHQIFNNWPSCTIYITFSMSPNVTA